MAAALEVERVDPIVGEAQSTDSDDVRPYRHVATSVLQASCECMSGAGGVPPCVSAVAIGETAAVDRGVIPR